MTDSDLELRIAWERHIGRESGAAAWLASVLSRYRESHRHYHDVRHVRWVVRHVETLSARHPVDDLDATVAAAFFHDVIYDPTASTNEADSAQLAVSALADLGWGTERVQTVEAMILGTAHHSSTGASVDEAVLFAADLAVLAADPSGYSDYLRNVRREYGHVSDSDWYTGRSAVLRSFLDRTVIFAPRLALDEWEQRARGNITAELRMLQG